MTRMLVYIKNIPTARTRLLKIDQHTNKVETNLLKIGTPAMFDENLGEIVS